MKRLALVLVLVLAGVGAGFGAPSAMAGTECRGLQSCILVVGPWVQVPAGPTPTYYHLACPGPGQTVGGLDADRARRAVDVTFLGALGGPVAPGTTTGREIVFVARATGARAVTFRPRLGCIPAVGGGGRSRTSYEPTRRLAAYVAAVRPAVTWRARSVRVRSSGQTVLAGCRLGERLLSFSSVIAFRTAKAPSAAQLVSVRSSEIRLRERLSIASARGHPPTGVRVQLQALAVCGA